MRPNKSALSRLKRPVKKIPSINPGLTDFQFIDRDGAILISDKEVSWTQDKCAEYIDYESFDGERNFIDAHVQFLQDEMQKGNFNPKIVVIASCELEGTNKVFKINGQHTCWAKFYLPQYIPVFRELRYRAKTMEQVKRLYAQFDRNKSRSETHLIKLHLINEDGFSDFPTEVVSRVCQGMKFWALSREEFRRVRAEDIAGLAKGKYKDVTQYVCTFLNTIHTGHRKILFRSPVIAAMYATFNVAPEVSREFWESVASGEMLSGKDSRYHLHNYLRNNSLSSKGFSRDTKKTIALGEDMYRICLSAWNKWRRKEDVTFLKLPKERQKVLN